MKEVSSCLINNSGPPPIQSVPPLILCRVEGWYPCKSIKKIPQSFIINTHWCIAPREKIPVVCVGTFSFSKKPEIMVHWHCSLFFFHNLPRQILATQIRTTR